MGNFVCVRSLRMADWCMQTSARGEEYETRLQEFVDELKTMPVAVQTDSANEQHYEVTPLTKIVPLQLEKEGRKGGGGG
jgi:hypothetical protein